MNKVLPLFAFSILLLVPAAQSAFAVTTTLDINNTGMACESLGGTWDNVSKTCSVTDVSVGNGDVFVIDAGVTLVVVGGPGDFEGEMDCNSCSFTIINNGKLQTIGGDGTGSGRIGNVDGTITIDNNGLIELNGGQGPVSGRISSTGGTINIDNDGTILTNGGDGTTSGAIQTTGGTITIQNKGLIQTMGGVGSSSGSIRTTSGTITITNEACGNILLNGASGSSSGSITDTSGTITITNHGTLVENPGSGGGSGIVKNTATIIDDPLRCLVAGQIIPVETTSLLLAGLQSSAMWFAPLILAGAGFAVYKLRKN